MKKLIYLSLLLLILTACVGQEEPTSTSTLDGAVLNETAVNFATADYSQTQAVNPTQTLAPIHTWTAIPTLERTRPSIQTPTPENACNMAAAGHPFDVTIPDGSVMAPGEPFSKTWRLENVGDCVWTRQYAVTFFSGNNMEALHNHYLPAEVEPGEMIDVTIDMTAPEIPGFYQGNWMLIDPQGDLFGIGPNGDAPFWVQIEVVLSTTDTPQPTPTVTNTPMVYLTGEASVINEDQFDLDTGTLNPEDVTQSDFVYQQSGELAYILMTMNGTEWAFFGQAEPTYGDCVEAELSGTAISGDDVPLGDYFCYKTSDGLPGWLFFQAFENGQLSISFLTWSTALEQDG